MCQEEYEMVQETVFHLLEMTANNAHTLLWLVTKKRETFKDYILKVVRELLSKHAKEKTKPASSQASGPSQETSLHFSEDHFVLLVKQNNIIITIKTEMMKKNNSLNNNTNECKAQQFIAPTFALKPHPNSFQVCYIYINLTSHLFLHDLTKSEPPES